MISKAHLLRLKENCTFIFWKILGRGSTQNFKGMHPFMFECGFFNQNIFPSWSNFIPLYRSPLLPPLNPPCGKSVGLRVPNFVWSIVTRQARVVKDKLGELISCNFRALILNHYSLLQIAPS